MLILVRHGQTALNAEGRLQGHIDLPLDEHGQQQARALAARIAERHRVARVVSSPLLRAQQTAGSIADVLAMSVDVDERFIELNYGEFDGLKMDEVPADVWAQWRVTPTFAPPGGESLVALDERVHPALEELQAQSLTTPGEAIVIVSHVSPIKSAVTWALRAGPEMTWRCSLDRASITTIAVTARGPSLVGFNDTSHL